MERQWNNCFDHGHAGQQLQLQQLDWQRNRLFFWNDQSGFNHNERANYRERFLHSESDAHAHANTDSDSYPDCHTYTYRAGDCSNKSCRSDVQC